MDSELDAQVRELIDRNTIWQILQRYSRGLDRFDREMVRSCFFDDAVEDHDNLFLGPVDAFIDWANLASAAFENCQHGLMNHYCELAGDEGYCETYFLFMGLCATPPHALSTGRYVDHFQRRNGEWRIANRVTIVEGSFKIDESPTAARARALATKVGRQPVTRNRADISYHRPPVPRSPTAA